MEKILRAGDKVTVHFIDHCRHKTPTEENIPETGTEYIYEVQTENNKLGIVWAEDFVPFQNFSWTVIFKNVDNGELFRYSDIKKDLENITDLQDGYVDKIVWLV